MASGHSRRPLHSFLFITVSSCLVLDCNHDDGETSLQEVVNEYKGEEREFTLLEILKT